MGPQDIAQGGHAQHPGGPPTGDSRGFQRARLNGAEAKLIHPSYLSGFATCPFGATPPRSGGVEHHLGLKVTLGLKASIRLVTNANLLFFAAPRGLAFGATWGASQRHPKRGGPLHAEAPPKHACDLWSQGCAPPNPPRHSETTLHKTRAPAHAGECLLSSGHTKANII